MIDYMAIANFLSEHIGEFCDECCDGNEDNAQEQINALYELANR